MWLLLTWPDLTWPGLTWHACQSLLPGVVSTGDGSASPNTPSGNLSVTALSQVTAAACNRSLVLIGLQSNLLWLSLASLLQVFYRSLQVSAALTSFPEHSASLLRRSPESRLSQTADSPGACTARRDRCSERWLWASFVAGGAVWSVEGAAESTPTRRPLPARGANRLAGSGTAPPADTDLAAPDGRQPWRGPTADCRGQTRPLRPLAGPRLPGRPVCLPGPCLAGPCLSGPCLPGPCLSPVRVCSVRVSPFFLVPCLPGYASPVGVSPICVSPVPVTTVRVWPVSDSPVLVSSIHVSPAHISPLRSYPVRVSPARVSPVCVSPIPVSSVLVPWSVPPWCTFPRSMYPWPVFSQFVSPRSMFSQFVSPRSMLPGPHLPGPRLTAPCLPCLCLCVSRFVSPRSVPPRSVSPWPVSPWSVSPSVRTCFLGLCLSRCVYVCPETHLCVNYPHSTRVQAAPIINQSAQRSIRQS